MSEPIRGYVHTSKAWYHAVTPGGSILRGDDEVMFGLYVPGGGTCGEMAMRWYPLGGRLVARLECYENAWQALYGFRDVLANLASRGQADPEQFCRLLEQNGFTDLTERERR